MPIPSKPPLLRNVIGYDADVFSLPDTTVDGSGALSYESGWPRITGLSLKAGGKAPQREYFNQVNKLLSQHLFFLQSGSLYDWSASLNYNVGAHVLGSDGLEYVAVTHSGPDVPGVGAKDPAGSKNKAHWLLLAEKLMSSDGGLVVDPITGEAAVDFDKMPPDKIEAILKSIRVPIWLDENKKIFVSQTTGEDSLDAGRGESEALPFKTPQAALDYVATNYNLGRYACTVILSHGVYEGDLRLPKHTSSTGKIIIKNADDEKSGVVLRGGIYAGLSAGIFDIQSITIENPPEATSPSSKNFYAVNAEQGAEVNLYNCHLDLKNTPPAQGSTFGIVSTGGIVSLRGLETGRPGLSIDSGESSIYQAIRASSRGYIAMLSDIDIQGQVASAVLSVSDLSLFDVQTPAGWEKPKFTGNVTGKRYQVTTNSIVSTGGGGPNFVVGTTDGSVSSGGQYN